MRLNAINLERMIVDRALRLAPIYSMTGAAEGATALRRTATCLSAETHVRSLAESGAARVDYRRPIANTLR